MGLNDDEFAVLFSVIALLICAFVGSFVLAVPMMVFWNYAVVAAISVANPISYWVAYWLSVALCGWTVISI